MIGFPHKPWKFRKNRERDALLRDIYIPKFRKIYRFLVSYGLPHPAPMRVKFGVRVSTAKFHPHHCNVFDLRAILSAVKQVVKVI